jgi:lipoic acid synthetase
VRDVRSSYDQSLTVLRRAHERGRASTGGTRLTKSSIMVGLGERDEEVVDTLVDLRSAGVDVVTIGQYLRPSPKHHEVVRFVPPETFAAWETRALELGFSFAASGPLVRSSYKAAEVFLRSLLGPGGAGEAGEVEAKLEARMQRAREEAARVARGPGEGELIAASSLVRSRS